MRTVGYSGICVSRTQPEVERTVELCASYTHANLMQTLWYGMECPVCVLVLDGIKAWTRWATTNLDMMAQQLQTTANLWQQISCLYLFMCGFSRKHMGK